MLYSLNQFALRLSFLLLGFASLQAMASSHVLISEDTIKPVFTVAPQSLSRNCEMGDISSALEVWYNTNAGAVATDNSGVVSINKVSSLNEIRDSLFKSQQNCFSFNLGFVAIDTCANASDTLYAEFMTFDNKIPEIIAEAATITVDCSVNINAQLEDWLDDSGGAKATDNCLSNPNWSAFFWVDSNGDTGNGKQGEGPYPTPRFNNCKWNVKVTFIVNDRCGNGAQSTASFIVEDKEAPQFVNPPADTIISCITELPSDSIEIMDNCTEKLSFDIEIESTRSNDSLSCDYFNFTITRTWTTMDDCGLEAEYTQLISIIDTLAPTFEAPSDITVYCGQEIDTSITGYPINVSNNCGERAIVSFSDTPLRDSCSFVINRFWEVKDVCGSSNTYPQVITVLDTLPPDIITEVNNILIDCSSNINLQDTFSQWITTAGFATVQDPCNEVVFFAAVPGSYDLNDINSFPGQKPIFQDTLICNPDSIGVLNLQQVDFVFYDLCGNASLSKGTFQVVDHSAPSFLVDPISETIMGDSDECGAIYTISLPEVSDNCTLPEEISITVDLDGNNLFTGSQGFSPIDTLLPVGSHDISYSLTDCAGNVNNKTITISIRDTIDLTSSCPEDIVVDIDSSFCFAVVSFPTSYSVTDNCFAGIKESETQPSTPEEALLTFEHNDTFDEFGVQKKDFVFTSLSANAIESDPILSLRLFADIDENGEFFTVIGEDGSTLGTVGERIGDSCNKEVKVQFTIDIDTYNTWAEDGMINISVIPNTPSNNTDFINPCNDSVINTGDSDGVSSMFLTISYQSLNANYYVTGATNIDTKEFPKPSFVPRDTLNIGENVVYYIFKDDSGAIDTCSFSITVEDNEAPIILCKTDTVFIHPSGLIPTEITETDVTESISDNCTVSEIIIQPLSFDCMQVGDTIAVNINVKDIAENESSCTSNVYVQTMPIIPTAEVGFCLGDTLRLFANIPVSPDTTNYVFAWTGPNEFTSTEMDPFVTMTSELSSGLYTINITGRNNCMSSGSVEVQIKGLETPVLTSNSTIICSGSSIQLSTNIITTNSGYNWFAGPSLDSIQLLTTTDTSSIEITPTTDTTYYYLTISNTNCTSDTSNIIFVTALDSFHLELSSDSLSYCVGDSIVFDFLATEEVFSYFWSGPDGFSSTSSTPNPITNISAANAGMYNVVANSGSCNSDTAHFFISIIDKVNTPQIRGQNTYCSDAELQLIADTLITASEFKWLLNDSLVQTTFSDTLIIQNIDTSYQGTWKVIASNGNCESDTSLGYTVNIFPAFDIKISSNAPICDGDSLRLSIAGGESATYNWTGPAAFISNEQSLVTVAIPGEYKVTVINSNGCGTIDALTIAVDSLPVISGININIPMCADSTEDMSLEPIIVDSTLYSFAWFGPNNFSSTDSIATLTNANANLNGQYGLIISNGSCVSDTAFATVAITDIPTEPILTGNELLCFNSSMQLSADVLEQEFDSLVWITPQGSFKTVRNSFITSSVTLADAGSYYVSLYINGCVSDTSNHLELKIVEQPDPPTITVENNGGVCIASDIRLSAEDIFGAIYEWRGPNGFTSNEREPFLTNVQKNNEGNYSVKITINDCESPYSADQYITVLNPPRRPDAFSNVTEICADQTSAITLCISSNTVTPGAYYRWMNISTNTELGQGESACFELVDLSLLSTGTNSIQVVTVLGECESPPSNSLSINIDRAPEGISAKVVGQDLLVCGGNTIDISANRPDGTSGEWSKLNNTIRFQNRFLNNTSVSNLSAGNNTLIWSLSAGNCIAFSSDTLLVRVEDEPILLNDKTFGAYHQNIEFNVFVNDQLPDEYTVRIVETPDGTSAEIDNDGNITFLPGNNFIGIAEVKYEVCNLNCSEICSEATLTVDISGELGCTVPTLITPNGDNINDAFIIPCLATGDYPNNRLIIFNAWGDEVYSASPYENDWEGTFNGSLLPVGTYYYILEFGSGERPSKGFLIIEQ